MLSRQQIEEFILQWGQENTGKTVQNLLDDLDSLDFVTLMADLEDFLKKNGIRAKVVSEETLANPELFKSSRKLATYLYEKN